METKDTTLRIEMVNGITTEIGLSFIQRLEQTDADVVDHSLDAAPAWEYGPCFDVDLRIDRPVDELVTLVRNSVPSSVAAVFSIWRSTEDEGEEIARLYAEPLPGLM
ncbi:hypothetical protein [Tritonibacter mobilis]|uniref:hypothetical protein n=1 Tax=Tritonibacter mobilis TaxID=379347 RepID=UPI003A5C144F